MRLTDAKPGALLILQGMPADPLTEHQVRALGLIPGARLGFIRRAPFRGPLLIDVGGRTIALGWRIASAIEVNPAAPRPEPD